MKSAAAADRSVQLVFASAFAILLIVGALAYHSMGVSRESERWVKHSYEVSNSLDNILLAMTSVDASTRGFVLTGDEAYLDSWRSGVSNLEQYALTVRGITSDNPNQQMHMQTVGALIALRIHVAEKITALRRTQGLDVAAQALRSGEGQRISNDFQKALQAMHAEEDGLLIQRAAVAKWRLRQTEIALIVGTALGLLITAVAGVGAVRNGARRRLAEAARRDSEDQYRTLLDAVHDYAILMLDVTGRVMTWNSSAARIKGYDAAQIIGETFSCFFPHEDIVRGRPEEILRIAATNGRHEEQSMRVRKDGSQFLASVTYTALKDATGKPRGFSEITRDLSETKESGAKFRGLLEAAPDAMIVVNERGEIVLVNLQAENQFGYHRDELLGKMVNSIVPRGFAERLSEDALQHATRNLRGAIEGSGALVTHDPLPSVMADEMQLTQLFQNLVGNAIKYRRAEVPRVHITAEPNDAYKWMFSVRDNGLGIESQFFERIFGVFQRLHKREEFDGTGIGLAICKKIVERHGGTISVESTVGKGSTFHFPLTVCSGQS